ELPGAGGKSSQSDLGEPRSDGVLPPAAQRSREPLARRPRAERLQQSDAALTDPQKYLDLTKTDTPPYFGPYTLPNPFFGLGNGFAPPRRLYLGAGLTF